MSKYSFGVYYISSLVMKHLQEYFVMNISLTIFCHLNHLYSNNVIIIPGLKSWE